MNLNYLNSLPEEKNKFKAVLANGEKVIFTSKNVIFGTEKQRCLGWETKITMTNKRIIADNGKGIWTIDIANDITRYEKVESGRGLNKVRGIAIDLKSPVVCGDRYDLIIANGYVFKFNKKDEARFLDIMRNVFV